MSEDRFDFLIKRKSRDLSRVLSVEMFSPAWTTLKKGEDKRIRRTEEVETLPWTNFFSSLFFSTAQHEFFSRMGSFFGFVWTELDELESESGVWLDAF